LHLVTTTVQISLPILSQSSHSFGRQFFWGYFRPSHADNLGDSYTVYNQTDNNTYLVEGQEAFLVLNNQSASNQILTTTVDNVQYSLIADTTINSTLDFVANTYASAASCEIISQKCNLTGHLIAPYVVSAPYNCSTKFSGDLGVSNSSDLSERQFTSAYFSDENLESKLERDSPSVNPFYFVSAARTDTVSGGIVSGPLETDPNFVYLKTNGLGVIFRCRVDIQKLQYTYSSGIITNINATAANGSEAALFLAPMLFTTYPLIALENMLVLAATSNSTSQQFIDTIQIQYSKLVAASASAVIRNASNILEQGHMQTLITRMPKAPLWTLAAFNLFYVLAGIILVLVILWERPAQGIEVKQRLSVAGLAANSFEPHENGAVAVDKYDLFDESKGTGYSSRIRMVTTESGPKYESSGVRHRVS
jgi:hypothetical protein